MDSPSQPVECNNPEPTKGQRTSQCDRLKAGLLNLTMHLIQAIDRMLSQFLRIDLRAAVRRGPDAIRQIRAVAFHLPPAGIVQQRPHGGRANVEAYNEGVAGTGDRGLRGRFRNR